MASDFVETLSDSFFSGPRFITGDPRREWSFLFLLLAPMISHPKIPKWASLLFSSVPSMYISGLAEKVTLPPDKFSFETIQFSNLKVPFPKGFELSSIQVQYLEDEIGSVHGFHQTWQSNIRGYLAKEGKNGKTKYEDGGGVVFEELGRVCATAIYAPGRKISVGGLAFEVPTSGADVWPLVFPVEVTRDPVNRGGNNISKVNVTYARVPQWSMPDYIYSWQPKEAGPGTNEPGNGTTLGNSVPGEWPG
jgi:hypothetical protein